MLRTPASKPGTTLSDSKTSDEPTRSAIVQNGRRIVHSTWTQRECIEEYDVKTDDLLIRKWRYQTTLGGWTAWEFEIGEKPRTVLYCGDADVMMSEAGSNPFMSRKDSRSHFVWRIRNLVWPKETYKVSIDEKDRKIIVRTTNKKYFTRFAIPDLDRAKLPLQASSIAVDYSNNTLVISYLKPASIMAQEQKEREERLKLTADKQPREGDVECNPS